MADAGELVVSLKGDIKDLNSKLDAAKSSVSSFGVGSIAVGTALGQSFVSLAEKAISFGVSAVKAFGEQEVALARLTNLVGKDAAQAFKEYADQMQRTTTFSDDAVLSLTSELASFGILPGSIKEASNAVIEFAAQTGKDLPEAGVIMAQAMAGQSRELRRFGLELSTTASRSENLEKTIKFLDDRFKGSAETLANTTIGQYERLTHQFDDLKKKIGEELLPVANKLLEWGAKQLEMLSHLGDDGKTYSKSLEEQKKKLDDMVWALKAQVSNGMQVTAQQKKDLENQVALIKSLQVQKKARTEVKGAIETEIDAIKKLNDQLENQEQIMAHLDEITRLNTEKKINDYQIELAQFTSDQERMTEITTLETQKRLATMESSYEANADLSTQLLLNQEQDLLQWRSKAVEVVDQIESSMASGVANMIMNGERFSDVLKSIWQDMLRAFIEVIAKMIAEWLVFEAITDGAGGALVGMSGGMASGGMVNEPSVITGLRSGKKYMVGEAGPEMVVPVNGSGSGPANEAMKTSGATGGGQSAITINIQGQFIEGSQAKWQRFIRETIVPEIRRTSMVMPTGPFKRVRGAA